MLIVVRCAVLFKGGPGIHHSVGKLLEPFASRIDKTGLIQKLYLVHRLDKETTGVMVLAKYVSFTVCVLISYDCRHYQAKIVK